MCFYNHTSQEYSSELPAIDPGTPINEGPAYTTNEDELQRAETAESNNESQSGMLEGQVWDGNDGEVFVPWPEEESQAMKTSPDAAGPRDGQPDTPEGKQSSVRAPCLLEKAARLGKTAKNVDSPRQLALTRLSSNNSQFNEDKAVSLCFLCTTPRTHN